MHGGGEDRLAKAFEEGGDFFKALLNVHLFQNFFQFGDDSALFGKRRNRNWKRFYKARWNARLSGGPCKNFLGRSLLKVGQDRDRCNLQEFLLDERMT